MSWYNPVVNQTLKIPRKFSQQEMTIATSEPHQVYTEIEEELGDITTPAVLNKKRIVLILSLPIVQKTRNKQTSDP